MSRAIPPPSVPVVGAGGLLNPVWRAYFEGLVGGTGGVTSLAPVNGRITGLASQIGELRAEIEALDLATQADVVSDADQSFALAASAFQNEERHRDDWLMEV